MTLARPCQALPSPARPRDKEMWEIHVVVEEKWLRDDKEKLLFLAHVGAVTSFRPGIIVCSVAIGRNRPGRSELSSYSALDGAHYIF